MAGDRRAFRGRVASAVGTGLLLVLAACGGEEAGTAGEAGSAVSTGGGPETQPSLAAAFEGDFRVGVAVGRGALGPGRAAERALILHHFNALTPENELKWESVHPEPGRYEFGPADALVDLAEQGDLFVVGHTLVWHKQTPDWVFQDADGSPTDRATLLARMRDHIHTVVGRYRGRVDGWDVVNEALDEDGTLRATPWLEIIGEDYVAKAFEFAREADPGAELYYNDYALANAPKRRGAVALVRRLRDGGVDIDGIGSQGHVRLEWPTAAAQDSTIRAFGDLGVKVMITELDVDVLPQATAEPGVGLDIPVAPRPELDPYREGLPRPVQRALADRYRELFRLYTDHRDVVDRVTFWGIDDGGSWLNDFPVRGRINHPLLFDRDGAPKPAFRAVLEAAGRPEGTEGGGGTS